MMICNGGNALKKRSILGFGIGQFGVRMMSGVMNSYLLLFYTDYFGISAATAGTIMLLTKLIDAGSDILVGSLADRTNTRIGRYRPWLTAGAVLIAISVILLFWTPDLSVTGKIIYAAITYILYTTCFTIYDVPYYAAIPSMSDNLNTRNRIISISSFFGSMGVFLVSTFAIIIINSLGGGQSGFTKFAYLMAAIVVVTGLVGAVNCKEEKETVKKASSLKEMGSMLKDNTPLRFLVAAILVNNLAMIARGQVGAYYMIYYMQRSDLLPLYMGCSQGFSILGALIAPNIVKKVKGGSRNLTIFAVTVMAGIRLLIFLFGSQSIMLVMILESIFSLLAGLPMVTIIALLSDNCDYVEYKCGKRMDGLIFSFNGLCNKIANASAGFMIGMVLSGAGYVANSTQQTSTALLGINVMATLVPMVLLLLVMLFTNLYPIKADQMMKIRAKVEARREKRCLNL